MGVLFKYYILEIKTDLIPQDLMWSAIIFMLDLSSSFSSMADSLCCHLSKVSNYQNKFSCIVLTYYYKNICPTKLKKEIQGVSITWLSIFCLTLACGIFYATRCIQTSPIETWSLLLYF